jgi:hypothetical protein
MATARWSSVAVALIVLLSASTALAKDKDDDDRDGNGPAFCRSGAGHPVHGWEWCRDRGWDRANGRAVRVAAQRRDDDWRNDRRRSDDRISRTATRRVNNIGFDNGYNDGYEKGLDDGRDRRSLDPTRHKWYRSGDHDYESRYGSRAQYENLYRDGFRRGYEAGYRDGDRYGNRRSGSVWPF